MIYNKIKPAVFLARPNRFVAEIELGGMTEIAHVKNTGRCKELLVPGANIFVQEFDSQKRKTKYDVISVYKDNRLINMDSQAPNKIFAEWAKSGAFIDNITLIKAESQYKDSRFDFYIETGARKMFVEVKGVTLEENGAVFFPDAPTQRGLKHINGLIDCLSEGYEAYAVFIVQMKDVLFLSPNDRTHQAFGDALRLAAASGVHLLVLDCEVSSDSITAKDPVELKL